MFSQMKFENLKHCCLSVCPRNTSGTGQTCLQQQLTGHKQKTCQCCQKRFRVKEKEENKKKGKCKAFCVSRKRINSQKPNRSTKLYIYMYDIVRSFKKALTELSRSINRRPQ